MKNWLRMSPGPSQRPDLKAGMGTNFLQTAVRDGRCGQQVASGDDTGYR